jgi:hypothetical protein
VHQDKETKIWVLDINQDDKETTLKSLKRPTHARQIPIHLQLLNLGFIDYIQRCEHSGEIRLFPELPYRGRNKYADKKQRWFNNTYTNSTNCNIKTLKNPFHSLRHNMATELSNQNMQPHQIAMMLGQKPDGGVTVTRYVKPPELKEWHEYLSKITYKDCIDFGRIRSWKHHDFAKNSRR